MYKPNYNFFFKINNRWFRYIPLFLIIFFFSFNIFCVPAQDNDDSQSLDSNSASDDSESSESDITTKIYRSTDNLGETPDGIESESKPALDADVINKEDLINMNSHLKKKIVHRKKDESGNVTKKSPDNVWLPWVLFTVILVLLTGLIKIIKRVKI